MLNKVRVWDLPLRLFHWTLLLAICGAAASGLAGGGWMAWHERCGWVILALLAFRLAWGLFGSTYARWSTIAAAPLQIGSYLRGQWVGAGHNPLGALSVFALLGMIGLQLFSGMAASDDIAFRGPLYRLFEPATADWLTGLHRDGKWWLLALVLLHVLAILYYALVKGRDLLQPMLRGSRPAQFGERDAEGGGFWGLLVSLLFAALVVWLVASVGDWLAPVAIPAPAPALDW